MDYILSNMDSLQKLRCERDLKNSIRKIRLMMDDPLQAKTLERKLNKYYFACGCQAGTIAVYITLLCCFFFWWSSGFAISLNWWRVAMIIFVSAIAGKLTGLFVSRYRLRKLFQVLEVYYTKP